MEASTLIPVAQAAELVGKSRMTLMKAIGKGKLSAVRDVHGRWQIDPAELTRVYRVVSAANGNQVPNSAVGSSHLAEVALAKVEALEARIAEQAATIADLRKERDQERTERVQAQAQVMALLPSPKKRTGLLGWLIGQA